MEDFGGLILLLVGVFIVMVGFDKYNHKYINKNGFVIEKISEYTDSTSLYKCKEKVFLGDCVYMVDSINKYRIGDTLFIGKR